MKSRTIRIDDEVYGVLCRERRPGERNFNPAIKRFLAAEVTVSVIGGVAEVTAPDHITVTVEDHDHP